MKKTVSVSLDSVSISKILRTDNELLVDMMLVLKVK